MSDYSLRYRFPHDVDQALLDTAEGRPVTAGPDGATIGVIVAARFVDGDHRHVQFDVCSVIPLTVALSHREMSL